MDYNDSTSPRTETILDLVDQLQKLTGQLTALIDVAGLCTLGNANGTEPLSNTSPARRGWYGTMIHETADRVDVLARRCGAAIYEANNTTVPLSDSIPAYTRAFDLGALST